MSLFSKQEKKLQKGMIITDDISLSPILDFDDYVTSLTKIIENSYPKFSVGIYGEWGTGKTTLMRSIYSRLKENNENNSIIPVWFNAWRYEREEQFAIIPLLKTIAYAIPEDKPEFKQLRQKIKKGAINVLKKIPDIIPSIAGHYFGEGAKNITEEMINGFKKEFIPKLELLAEIDKDTIYFDGLDNITAELQKIRDKNDSFKIVVFVDDLDRCSPDKALQVLESIKVFLDSDGFIYVIGLSFNKISQLVTAYYKGKYKDVGIEGDQYLKKIIQIPIILSDWNSEDIKSLLQDFIKNKVIENEDYRNIIEENIDLISTGLEENPRETKRFLNNFIVAQEIFSKKGTKPKELLVLQILNMRWNEMYRLIVNSNGTNLDKLKLYIENKDELKKLADVKPEDTDFQPEFRILQKLRTDQKFWKFLADNYNTMKNVSDWHLYRRASKIAEESAVLVTETNKRLKAILQRENVREFNSMRTKFGLSGTDLSKVELPLAHLKDVDFGGINLEGANLENADLTFANFHSANLSSANLRGAKLIGAEMLACNLVDANLEGANLTGANLPAANCKDAMMRGANLENAILEKANLEDANLDAANLSTANLDYANLSGAQLAGSNLDNAKLVCVDLESVDLAAANLNGAIIISPKRYDGMFLNRQTKISKAIIDDTQFIQYIKKHTNRLPKNIPDKNQLKLILREKGLRQDYIQYILKLSRLPE